MWNRVCPFCKKIHSVNSPYLNTICECGGKYYAITGTWLNRVTGEEVKNPRSKCMKCKKCKRHKINKDETGFNCLSYGYTRRILLNLLEYEETLSSTQIEALNTVIETIEKLDKEIDN